MRSSLALGCLVLASLAFPASALAAADISTTLSPNPASVRLTTNTTVTLTASNAGPDPATNVQVVTVLPPELSFQGFMSISQGIGTFSSGTVTASFGTINSGANATLVYVLRGDQSGNPVLPADGSTTAPDSNTANDDTQVTIPVTAIEVSSAALSFGEAEVGRLGAARTLTVTNRATAPFTLDQLPPGGAAAGDYVLLHDSCSGSTLAVDASCEVSRRFAPSAEGARDATLTLDSTAAGVSPVAVPLSGTGTPVPAVAGPPGAPGPPGPTGATGPPVFRLVIAAIRRSITATAGRRVSVGYVSTLRANTVLDVLKGRRRVARVRGRARVGANALRFRSRRVTPGRYTLRLTATNGSQTARATMRLRVRAAR